MRPQASPYQEAPRRGGHGRNANARPGGRAVRAPETTNAAEAKEVEMPPYSQGYACPPEPTLKLLTSGRLLPILIIPGFMSSGLEVKSSAVSKSWVGKRVWINLSALGFESLYWGSALQLNEARRRESAKPGGRRDSNGAAGYSEEMHQDYVRQLECKNNWLKHMRLSDDMVTETEGMEVRPIPGLAGVDYLTPGALTSHVSYVFGPVIRALRKAGYTDDNLDAAPYDWRLPPSKLEERDGYFTSTMRRVEELSNRSGGAPVVLLCHSMGCKTGHYFLNFARNHPSGGRTWLDTYIHTYMPVGAPHLGAPKSLRATVDGDKMGLDAFLTDDEGLLMGRSLGSGPWLMPRSLSAGADDAPPNVYLRREGALEVSVSPIDCSQLLRTRKGSLPKLRLRVMLGKQVLTTDFHALGGRGGNYLEVPGTFVFSTPDNLSQLEGGFQMTIEEPGIGVAKKERKEVSEIGQILRGAMCIACCPIKYVLCLPCTLAKCVVCTTLCTAKEVTLQGADATASAVGSGTTLAWSHKFPLHGRLAGKTDAQILVSLVHIKDRKVPLFSFFRKQRCAAAEVRLRWIPPPSGECRRTDCEVATLGKKAKATSVRIEHQKKNLKYLPSDGIELLETEELERVMNLIRNHYNCDKLGPRSLSADEPPPVRRVKAIYGINRPTEVGAVYRRCKSTLRIPGKVQKLRELDVKARSVKTNGKNDKKLRIQGGIVFETKETAQIVGGKRVYRSGDGTVPYWSLSHCLSWAGACDVSTDEIEGAEHRQILADARFHKAIIDYVNEATA